MEASAAGLSGGDAGAQADGGLGLDGNNGFDGNGHADFSAILEQTQQLASGMEEMRQYLMEQPHAGLDGYGDGDALDGDGSDGGLTAEQLEALANVPDGTYALDEAGDPIPSPHPSPVQAEVQRQVQQTVAPLYDAMQQLAGDHAEVRNEQAATQLAIEFPELQDPAAAGTVIDVASQIADELGVPSGTPQFWKVARLAYLAGRAIDAAQEEGDDAPRAAHLEGGSGAGPGGSSSGSDFLNILQNAGGRGSSALPFQ
jgi:hypothetical protein